MIIVIIALFCFFELGGRVNAIADDKTVGEFFNKIQESNEKLLNGIDFSTLDTYLEECNISDKSFFTIMKDLLNSDEYFTLDKIIDKLLELLFGNVKEILPHFGAILAVIITLAIVETLSNNSFDKNLLSLCNFIGVGVIIGIVGAMFISVYRECMQTINSLTGQIQTAFPIMMTLMTAVGGGKTAGIFNPTVGFICQGLTLITTKILLPLVCLIIIFACVNSFSDGLKLEKSADFCKTCFKWIIGISSVVFCFFITAQSVSASAYDSISIKALRYTMGNFLPLLGSLFSSGFDAVIASCVTIKNALGSIVLALIILTAFAPIAKIICLNLILKLVAAICEPIGNSKTTKLLSGLSDGFTYLATSIAVVSVVYMITVLLSMCALGVSL